MVIAATVQPVYNGPEAVTLYITVTGQLPKIFSCLPQQRVAVVHRFDYVTINRRFRYSYTFLGARDSSSSSSHHHHLYLKHGKYIRH